MEYTKKFDSYVSKNFDKFIRKPELIYGVIILILALYSAHIAPKLPASIVKIFDNSFFKLFMFILILWVAQISPSISILLAVVFLLLLNYITTQKFWESLDNITTTYPPITIEPTPINAVNATNALTIQGLSATAAPQEVITSAAKTITGAIPEPTPVVVNALDTLIKSAASSTPGNVTEVGAAMNTLNTAINANISSATITQESKSQAVQVLANAASTPGVNNNAVIATAANIITTAAPQTTPAVAALATQATQAPSTPVDKAELKQTLQSIVSSLQTTAVPAPVEVAQQVSKVESGCYPMRHIDMSKVQPGTDDVTIEDYQPFVPTM